ncbi:MAG: hypothetical protein B6I24_09430 [Bacteroidetes bacterium 4572_128]|nr:MAG: hypothetical protein B6I24_09430 [Bacteroidetes bacterium 4572_128]
MQLMKLTMRKINKNIKDIPISLNSKNTEKKRNELIKSKKLLSGNFNANYKAEDVKNKLNEIYHQKCAYCEQKVEQIEIEHYRPKSIYYWLIYSWDNLFFVCPKCNKFKNNYFENENERVNFEDKDLTNIHQLRDKYDKIEKPKVFNPEKENPQKLLKFDKKGKIFSKHENLQFTINLCQLNREYLTDKRKKFFDETIRIIKISISGIGSQIAQKEKLNEILKKDDTLEFTAYRNFCKEILKKMLKF